MNCSEQHSVKMPGNLAGILSDRSAQTIQERLRRMYSSIDSVRQHPRYDPFFKHRSSWPIESSHSTMHAVLTETIIVTPSICTAVVAILST